MIDLHCHILPGLDDGAQSMEEALEMARMAVQDGMTDIVATPHTYNGLYLNRAVDILKAVDDLQQALDRESIPLRIHPGAEVHVHAECIEHILSSEILTICNGRKYLLLELPFHHIPRFTDDLLYELKIQEIIPIIAHPERNAVLCERPNILVNWIQEGALAQLTAGSLLGHLGERAKSVAEYMVEHGLVHVIASDAHNTRRRRPELRAAYLALAEKFSPELAECFKENARIILRGESLQIESPIARPKKKKKWLFF